MTIKNHIIRALLAGVLLILFAFSITPRKMLHDLIVDHEDDTSVLHAPQASFSKSGFHCHCDNFVAESPFTDEGDEVVIMGISFFASHQSALPVSFHTSSCFFFELRGPPATA